MLRGIEDAGVPVQVSHCDLSEPRMYITITCPEIAVEAPALLGKYRKPVLDGRGADNPLVLAGFVLTHSETDQSSFSLTPRLTMHVCANGLPITSDAIREPHLGSRVPAGPSAWTAATHRRVADLVASRTRAAARAFLAHGYLQATVSWLQADAGQPVRHAESTIDHVSRALRFRGEQRARVLEHFLAADDLTSGGVLHAVTSAAQVATDPDDAHEMESAGVRAMRLAAAHSHQHEISRTP